MINQSRRTLLKGAAYGSALSLGAMSGMAIAGSGAKTCDVHLLPTQNSVNQTLSLFNHTDESVTIVGIDQIKLDQKNYLAVKTEKAGKRLGQDSVTLGAGESGKFTVAANNGDYQGFELSKDMLPLTVFDSVAA